MLIVQKSMRRCNAVQSKEDFGCGECGAYRAKDQVEKELFAGFVEGRVEEKE